MRALIFFVALAVSCAAQQTPDLEAQRSAMKKLEFMVGKWAGEARIFRGPDNVVVMTQTEEAQYKLDGLVLVIEGVGKADGKPALQALGIVSYDDQSGTYHMRAFNDGRFLETEVKLAEEGKGMTWGFALGQIHMNSTMRIDQKGDWTELHNIVIDGQAPRKYMEVSVSRRK
jgi:hypothetical protein